MMYFISTHINADESEYEDLTTAVKALGPWSNRLKNCWLVESNFSSGRIRDLLKPHLQFENGDRMFVGQFTNNWAGTGMGADFPDWLKRRNFEPPVKPVGH